ncbi:hypothetical protein L6164_008661 [Bauhinia variegata]|uniref:Uncharacterized protein n=1 Tax=Bauhinia variegata TaxID=167791 RepID=A0ACB9PN16_BAUVA|nr:hypothetical protein L6164_008661 [Bauhinia variegata]
MKSMDHEDWYMNHSSSNPSSQSKSYNQSTYKKGRHATQLRELTLNRNGEQRIQIEFDKSIGNPLGPTRKQFKSYAALLEHSNAKDPIVLDAADKCELYVKDRFHLVAYGKVYNLGPTIHHKQIEDDMKPCQTCFREGIVGSNKDISRPQPNRQVNPLMHMCEATIKIETLPMHLHLDPDVIGKPYPMPFYISQKDILAIITGADMLCILVIQLWLMSHWQLAVFALGRTPSSSCARYGINR